MDEISRKILHDILNVNLENLDESLIPREILLDDNKYEEIKKLIHDLKKYEFNVSYCVT